MRSNKLNIRDTGNIEDIRDARDTADTAKIHKTAKMHNTVEIHNTTEIRKNTPSAEKKRFLQELTHLEKAHKSGIVSKEEVASAKIGIDKKIRALEHKEKQTIAKNKAVEEILGASLHVSKQSSQKKALEGKTETSTAKEIPCVEIVDLPESALYTPLPSAKRHTKYFSSLTFSKNSTPKTEQKKVFKETNVLKEHKFLKHKEQSAPREIHKQKEEGHAVAKTPVHERVSDSSSVPHTQPEYRAIDELVEEEDTNWRFALAVLTIFLLILLYIKFTSYGASGDILTVDAYLDYASPYSRDMHGVLVTLQSEYADTLWVEYHLMGITEQNILTAAAVSCADAQQRKQEYFAYLFTTENTLVTIQEFTAAAETLGLVSADFATCLSTADSSRYLQQQQEYEALDILYTPTLVVNNKKIIGAVGYDAVKSVFDEQLLQLG